MKKEVANTTLNKSPQDAIQLIQSGLVMIIGLLIAVTGLIITLNGGSTLWGCLPDLRMCLIGAPHQKQKQPVTGYTEQDFFTVHYV